LLTSVGFVSTITTFTPYYKFNIVAGIGPYNVSFAYDYDPNFVTALFTSRFSGLFEDFTTTYPLTPTLCSGNNCTSYLFPGSFEDMDPYPGHITNYSEADVLVVPKASGIQIQYWDLDSNDHPNESDCKTFGNDAAALVICLASSSLNSSHLIASSSMLDCS